MDLLKILFYFFIVTLDIIVYIDQYQINLDNNHEKRHRRIMSYITSDLPLFLHFFHFYILGEFLGVYKIFEVIAIVVAVVVSEIFKYIFKKISIKKHKELHSNEIADSDDGVN